MQHDGCGRRVRTTQQGLSTPPEAVGMRMDATRELGNWRLHMSGLWWLLLWDPKTANIPVGHPTMRRYIILRYAVKHRYS